MQSSKLWRSLRVGVAVLGLAGCASDSGIGPAAASNALTVPLQASPGLISDALSATLKLLTVKSVNRDVALTSDVTVSRTIGVEGGTISIPAAGFTLTIPPKAVSEPTAFTVTALKGKALAYEMGPHGMKFSQALDARQDLNGTNAKGTTNSLKGGYFTDKSLIGDLLSTVTELIKGVLSANGTSFNFPIKHFSGYTVGWDE